MGKGGGGVVRLCVRGRGEERERGGDGGKEGVYQDRTEERD